MHFNVYENLLKLQAVMKIDQLSLFQNPYTITQLHVAHDSGPAIIPYKAINLIHYLV